MGEPRSTAPSLSPGGELASGDVGSACIDVASVVVGESVSEPVHRQCGWGGTK